MPDPNVRQTPTTAAPLGNPVRDLKNVRRNVAATAGELREFMGRLRGKTPREMLGVVASSSLVKGIVTATIGAVVLIVVLTVIPYGLAKFKGTDKPVAEETTESEPLPAPESAGSTTPEAPESPDPNTPVVEPADPLDVLGVGEEKPAPPDSNPLDGSVDNLFDDIK